MIKCEVVETIMIHELTKLEKKLMIEETVNFSHFCHNKSEFCIFSLKNFPRGNVMGHQQHRREEGTEWTHGFCHPDKKYGPQENGESFGQGKGEGYMTALPGGYCLYSVNAISKA